jgi:4-hydroxy-tetrahydrodipicolinate synthase/2-keto-3-deoxy-L-arabinonate dehydratase
MAADETRPLAGIFPIIPTIFAESGDLDEVGQRATVDFLIRFGVHGLVVLTNAGEGFAVSDEESSRVAAWVIAETAGRVPFVVTSNHPGTVVAVRAAWAAEAAGTAAIMFPPPFFGQWLSDLDGVARHAEGCPTRPQSR